MNSIFTLAFWKDATERAIKTGAQALVLAWSGDQFFNVLVVDWKLALGAAASGAVLSVLTSIISAPFGNQETASLIAD